MDAKKDGATRSLSEIVEKVIVEKYMSREDKVDLEKFTTTNSISRPERALIERVNQAISVGMIKVSETTV